MRNEYGALLDKHHMNGDILKGDIRTIKFRYTLDKTFQMRCFASVWLQKEPWEFFDIKR